MDNFIKQIIEETFKSKKQARYFYAKSNDKTLSKKERNKWKKWTKEFSEKTDFEDIPEEIDEIVDENGNIKRGDEPGIPTQFITSKSTTDQVVPATSPQMGSFGILGGGFSSGGSKTLRYWAESDQSKALGFDDTLKQDVSYEDAKDHFTDELGLTDKEAEDRVENMGYDPELPEGKLRLIENPKRFIEEYIDELLKKKTKPSELVKKDQLENEKKEINPIVLKQLKSIKQTLKSNNISINDIIEYLEDNE